MLMLVHSFVAAETLESQQTQPAAVALKFICTLTLTVAPTSPNKKKSSHYFKF